LTWPHLTEAPDTRLPYVAPAQEVERIERLAPPDAALASIPQSTFVYEALPLFLIAKRIEERDPNGRLFHWIPVPSPSDAAWLPDAGLPEKVVDALIIGRP